MANRLNSLQQSLVLGAGLVVAVIFITMGWKAALLVGAALPLSSLMVFAGMRLCGIPIHQMSVTGLIVALGMLIDNAIIVVDAVHTRLRQGRSPAEAVTESVRHLLVPLLGSTLTTVLAFMPLVLMPGGAGEFVGPIGMSVILALFSSFFVALAGLAHRFDETPHTMSWWRAGIASPRLTQFYCQSLAFFLQHPLLGIVSALILPVLGFFISGQLEEQFFPPSDRDQFQIQMTLPTHASLHHTKDLVLDANAMLQQHLAVKHVHWFVGGNAPKFYYNMIGRQSDAAYFAQALVQLHDSDHSFAHIQALQEAMDQRFPAAQVIVK